VIGMRRIMTGTIFTAAVAVFWAAAPARGEVIEFPREA
jgi:hypothetical protein